MATKVLDCDTITQVKEKVLEQTWKSTSYSLRPATDSLHLGRDRTEAVNGTQMSEDRGTVSAVFSLVVS